MALRESLTLGRPRGCHNQKEDRRNSVNQPEINTRSPPPPWSWGRRKYVSCLGTQRLFFFLVKRKKYRAALKEALNRNQVKDPESVPPMNWIPQLPRAAVGTEAFCKEAKGVEFSRRRCTRKGRFPRTPTVRAGSAPAATAAGRTQGAGRGSQTPAHLSPS